MKVEATYQAERATRPAARLLRGQESPHPRPASPGGDRDYTTGQSTAPEVPRGSSQVRHPQRGWTRQMGSMGNVVVNTIVRMFTRKAVDKAMKSAKKSMGTKKGKQDGGHKGRPKRKGAKNKKVID